MKLLAVVSTVVLMGISTAFAGFSERKLASAKGSAQKSGKLIAFVFYQDYALPNCPKCVAETDAANNGVEKGVPRADVVMVEIESGDKDLDKLPTCVPKDGPTPRVVITDAACGKVVAKYEGTPAREKIKQLKADVKKARTDK